VIIGEPGPPIVKYDVNGFMVILKEGTFVSGDSIKPANEYLSMRD
jgi:hypothetical protein